MNKTALAFILAGLLTGCASVYTAPTQQYQPRGTTESQTMTGSILKNGAAFPAPTHKLIIKINGDDAMIAEIGNGDADTSAKFQDKTIQALCKREEDSFLFRTYFIDCRVLIAGDLAGTFHFDGSGRPGQ